MTHATAIADARRRRCTRALAAALLAAFALAGPAAAQIQMRDDGADGLTFFSAPGGEAMPDTAAAPKRRPGRAAPSGARASRQQLVSLVAAAAATHGLPEDLLTAVIEVESNFNPGAVSPKGAQGLMQLMPQTARHLGLADPSDPAANIDAGARYLKQLLTRFRNNLPLALAAYNAGPGSVQRSGAIPAFAETQRYVPRVIQRYHKLQSESPAPR